MSTITKERIELFIKNPLENGLTRSEQMEVARIALASLEADPIGEVSEKRYGLIMDGTVDLGGKSTYRIIKGEKAMKLFPLGTKFYTAPPAPVSVPAAMEIDDDFDSAFEHGKAVGWNAYRAAMLQGADRPQNEPQNIPENIPATQFKPVADLYGLTSPTGGETSFTFDAVEARDFIDGGWSCQEYVELERFQEAVSGNHPVIPDSWTKCSERMPEKDGKYLVASSFGIVTAWFDPAWSNKFQDCDTNCDEGMEDFEGKVFRVTHWQSLPAAPKQGDE